MCWEKLIFLRYTDDITLMAESEEELKRLLMRLKDESEKAGLKIMASSPITSWQIDGGKMETVTDFISLGSKITADGDCNHKIKTLAPWKKSYDQPRQHIKKETLLCQQRSLSSKLWFF